MNVLNYFCKGTIALMLCAGFISCGDDNEPTTEGGIGGPDVPNYPKLEKRISRINEYIVHNNINDRTSFIYNEKGQLIKCECSTGSDESYIWDENTVTVNNKSYSPKYKYTFDNMGILVSSISKLKNESKQIIDTEHTYTYKNNHLTTELLKSEGKETFIPYNWQDEHFMGYHYTYEKNGVKSDVEKTVMYAGSKIKGSYILTATPNSDNIFKAYPEMTGILTDYMPDRYTEVYIDTMFGNEFNGSERQVITKYIRRENYFSQIKKDQDGYLSAVRQSTYVTYYTEYSFKDLNKDGIITSDEQKVRENAKEQKAMIIEMTFTWK